MAYDMNEGEALEALARATPQWLAGFFDGEGCICSRNNTQRLPNITVSIEQAEPKVIAVIAFKFNFRIIEHEVRGRKYFGVCMGGRSALPFLKVIKDYVICKRRQVEAAIELLSLVQDKSDSRATVKEDIIMRREELAKIIRESNGAVNRVEVINGVDRDT